MKKLSEKFEDERKRLREQMEADIKAQQNQMANMMNANMKRAEEDRKAFMQEKQALNARFGEMQRSNNEMQETIKGLEKQLHENLEKQREVSKPGFFEKAVKLASGVADVAGKVAGVVALATSSCSVM